MGDYRDLLVYQKAYALTLTIYRATISFPSHEIYGLTSQLRRAAASVTANIAEGHSRYGRKEYLHFISLARGSAAEVETFLSLASDLSYLDSSAAKQLGEQVVEVRKILTGLTHSLLRSKNT